MKTYIRFASGATCTTIKMNTCPQGLPEGEAVLEGTWKEGSGKEPRRKEATDFGEKMQQSIRKSWRVTTLGCWHGDDLEGSNLTNKGRRERGRERRKRRRQ